MAQAKFQRLFGTNGIRGVPNQDLNSGFCTEIGKAIGTFFAGSDIAMGTDTRDSRHFIRSSVLAGILSQGVNVIDLGVLPTPAIQYYCKTHKIPGVVITASHNPPQFNGIKCIDRDGTELRRESEEQIEKIYWNRAWKDAGWENVGSVRSDNTAAEAYISAILSMIDHVSIRQRNFRIAVDTGNGAAYSTTPGILRKLGCTVVTLNAFPDGRFTSRESEPKPENLRDLMRIMEGGGFDLGIAHDGDADRAVFFDAGGNFVDGDRILSILVREYASSGDTVVTPISSSDALDEICRLKGARLIRTKVGAPIVARTMIDMNGKIGGEENGGVIFGPHQYCRDGAMTAALVIDLMARSGKSLATLVSEIPQYWISKMAVKYDGNWEGVASKIRKHAEGRKIQDIDGLKVFYPDGWVLIRASGTEPIVRVYGESPDRKKAETMAQDYVRLISEK